MMKSHDILTTFNSHPKKDNIFEQEETDEDNPKRPNLFALEWQTKNLHVWVVKDRKEEGQGKGI